MTRKVHLLSVATNSFLPQGPFKYYVSIFFRPTHSPTFLSINSTVMQQKLSFCDPTHPFADVILEWSPRSCVYFSIERQMYVRLFAKKSLVFRINVVVGINVLVEIWVNLYKRDAPNERVFFCIFYKKKDSVIQAHFTNTRNQALRAWFQNSRSGG